MGYYWQPAVYLLVTGLVFSSVAGADRVTTDRTADGQLRSWRWEDAGMSLELIQRLPDQTRAFFLARGFDSQSANAIALGCVFQTIFRNTATQKSADAVEINLADWRVRTDSGVRSLRLKEQWDVDWATRGVPEAARIAFRWALFPTRQVFAPGDYSWGMISFDLPPDQPFDLEIAWRRNDRTGTDLIRDIECPPDRHL